MTQQQGAEAVLHDAFSSGPAGNQPERSREVRVRKDFSEADQALHLAVSLGTMLLVNGAEINRVEDSMRRVLAAYGAIEPEVFTISSCIIVSVLQEGGQATTRLKRITSRSTDMEKFARLNALSRRLVREKPPYEEAIAALNEILKTPAYPPFVSVFGFFIAAEMFTMRWSSKFYFTPLNFARRRFVKLQNASIPLMWTDFSAKCLDLLIRKCLSYPTSTSPS